MTGRTSPNAPPSKRERIVFILMIVVGIGLSGFFGLRTVKSYVRLQRMGLDVGASHVEHIRGWMTIPYIAKAFQTPQAYLFKQLGIPQEGYQKHSLVELNEAYDLGGREAILKAIQEAITRYRSTSPTVKEEPEHG